MPTTRSFPLVACVASLFGATDAFAGTRLEFLPGAEFMQGCFPPCLCPIMWTGETSGTMRITLTKTDPLYAYYAVDQVQWTVKVNGLTNPIKVSGSGTYTVGGEVALLHRLELDLSLDGQPAEHFDSGWVPPTTTLPYLDATVSVNNQFCWDTVFRVLAGPAQPDGDLTGDGCVDQQDLGLLLADYGCSGGGCEGDLDLDGDTDQADLGILLADFKKGCP